MWLLLMSRTPFPPYLPLFHRISDRCVHPKFGCGRCHSANKDGLSQNGMTALRRRWLHQPPDSESCGSRGKIQAWCAVRRVLSLRKSPPHIRIRRICISFSRPYITLTRWKSNENSSLLLCRSSPFMKGRICAVHLHKFCKGSARHHMTILFRRFRFNYRAITVTTATNCHPRNPLYKGEVAEWQLFRKNLFTHKRTNPLWVRLAFLSCTPWHIRVVLFLHTKV